MFAVRTDPTCTRFLSAEPEFSPWAAGGSGANRVVRFVPRSTPSTQLPLNCRVAVCDLNIAFSAPVSSPASILATLETVIYRLAEQGVDMNQEDVSYELILRHPATVADLEPTGSRPEVFVRSRSPWKADGDSMSSVQRQRQLPLARPGTFIRASAPKLSKSCNGAI